MTSYSYPTWADILGKEFRYFENWGRGAAGNHYIFNSVIECLARNKLTSDDNIIILWTGVARIDYYQMNEWGHLVNKHISDVKRNNEPISCPDGYEIISYAYFNAIEQILKVSGINYEMYSWHDYDRNSRAGRLYNTTLDNIKRMKFKFNDKVITRQPKHDLELFYKRQAGTSWPKLEDIFTYDKNLYDLKIQKEVEHFINSIESNRHQFFDYTTIDTHPLPAHHLEAVQETFTDIPISNHVIAWVNDINQKMLNNTKYQFVKSLPKERL